MQQIKSIKKTGKILTIKDPTQDRRNDVIALIEKMGTLRIPVKEIAEKHKVSLVTVYGDIKWFKEKYEFESVDAVKIELDTNYKTLRLELSKMLARAPDPREKLAIIREFRETNIAFVKNMEDFGMKEKIADKVQLENKPSKEMTEFYAELEAKRKEFEALNKKLNESKPETKTDAQPSH